MQVGGDGGDGGGGWYHYCLYIVTLLGSSTLLITTLSLGVNCNSIDWHSERASERENECKYSERQFVSLFIIWDLTTKQKYICKMDEYENSIKNSSAHNFVRNFTICIQHNNDYEIISCSIEYNVFQLL